MYDICVYSIHGTVSHYLSSLPIMLSLALRDSKSIKGF